MPNFKLTIEYDGTDFCGWQIQRANERTVQAEIKKALEKIVKHPVTVIGAGRTDSGVHALGQVAHVRLSSSITPSILLKALNANLPEDIAILGVKKVSDDFHAQFSARSKIYRYTILNRESRCANERKFCLHIRQPIDIPMLTKAARVFIGRHDFRAFRGSATPQKRRDKSKTTVRTVHKIVLRRRKDFIFCDIEANGFLYKMVRNIVGTLLDVSAGRIRPKDLKAIMASGDRRKAGKTAAAHGLCLYKVNY